MSILESLQTLATRLATTLLPQQCLLCGADGALRGQRPLCAGCMADLPLLGDAKCQCCALPLAANEQDHALCGRCLTSPPHFDATHAVYRYAFPTDKLIQALKYHRRLVSADFLADALMALPTIGLAETGLAETRPDLILPVPLSAQRLAERGFNQAVELARPLARQLRVPLALDAVRRVRHSTPQARLPWKVRAKNIRHAFECEIDLSDKSVWVVDDVMTTGATLDELARVLKLHGARRVENRVVARAVRNSPSPGSTE